MTDLDRRTTKCAFPWQMMLIDLTGEVMPCPYFHLSRTNECLGNTNRNSVEQIWNGPGYQDLRRRHASGDLQGHPCGSCYAYRSMGGHYPIFEWGNSFRLEQGLCYTAQIPEHFWRRHRGSVASITLCEDGVPLPMPNAMHDDIRKHGGGRYSVWRGHVYASTPDGSNPAANGRRYDLHCGEDETAIASLKMATLSSDNLSVGLREYLNGSITLAARPSKVTFIETSDCNIDCPSCSQNEVRLNRVRHRPNTNPDVLAHLPYLQELIWHGGEPYLMRRFRDFVDSFRSEINPNLTFGFMSNGTMITSDEARKLDKFDRFSVTISMDSFVRSTYERMRVGANYEKVLSNLHRLLKMQDWPDRKVVVAMIIGKTNILDLPHNLRYAQEHDIRLMVNPMTVYPPTEKLNLFADFERQTQGWSDCLAEAESIVSAARARDESSFREIDPSGALREMRTLHERAQAEHSDLAFLEVSVLDPHGSLAKMPRPGILVCPIDGGPYQAVSYAELIPGKATAVVKIPHRRKNSSLRYSLFPNLFELGSEVRPFDQALQTGESARLQRVLSVPPYEPPARMRNIAYAKLAMRSQAEPDRPAESEAQHSAWHTWQRFLVNYLRPFWPDQRL